MGFGDSTAEGGERLRQEVDEVGDGADDAGE